MRRVVPVFVCALLSLAFAPALAGAVELSHPSMAAAPEVRVLAQDAGQLRLEFQLGELGLEQLPAAGEDYQALTLTGGGLEGEVGAPGLPVFTRLVALPAGVSARVSVTERSETRLEGFRLLPVQPDGGEEFVIDRAAYARGEAAREPVSVGEPGILRDLRVVPVTFRPVGFDPRTGEVRVIERMEVAIDFAPDAAARSPRARTTIPESFDHLYRDAVVNYEQSDLFRGADVNVGPGTYLLIYENESGVATRLQPLIDWRRRQGYNVIAATTGETGTTTTQIKNFIQNQYDTADPPLEFVTLAGDASGTYLVNCYTENISGYGGEGDHYYTLLEGGDILADVHIGRLSFRSLTELENIVEKIVTYETDPPMSDPGWFTRGGVCGDSSSSGIAVIYANQWVKSQLLANGYTQVDTIWGGNFPSAMSSTINQGLSAWGYRGWWGMSGFSSSSIQALQNGKELPFAVVVTCDTGSFKDDATCQSEAFLKAANGGAIGAVGTATIGTHTRYNNTYYYGCWDGALNGSDHRLGVAHTRGKLELYANYELSEPEHVDIWSMWNNLMGDPATDMYTGFPAALTASYPAQLPPGANAVPVTVHADGLPAEGARVSLFKDGEVAESAYTDAAGQAVLPLPGGMSQGEMLVTVTGHNLLAHLGSLEVASVAAYAALAASSIDDATAGDGDGQIDPGETFDLNVSLRNFGSGTATGVNATLTCGDDFVTILDGSGSFGDIGPGAEVFVDAPFRIAVAPETPDGHAFQLILTANSGLQSWTSQLELIVHSAAFSYESLAWSGGTGLDPGESGTLDLELRNTGSTLGADISATLVSHSPWVTVTDADGAWGDVFPGATGTSSDGFGLDVSADAFPGHLATLSLVLSFNGAAVDEVELQLPVGTASLGDPTGPDGYGYYAFESTDTGHPQAPSYDWFEIQPSQGGDGTVVGLGDWGWAQDDTEAVDLPFTFRYYGQDFDVVSICSNGWVSMGVTGMANFRNYTIPGAGTPPAMIAPFWDDWYQTSGNMVSYYDDAANHRFIVEWYNVRNEFSGSNSTFQLILLDPAYHPTATGDGEIIFQYKSIVNNDSVNGYATAGIQAPGRQDGLLLTYWNQHPGTNGNPTANRAIRLLPLDDALRPAAAADPAALELTLPLGGTVSRSLEIGNVGDPNSVLYYALDTAALPSWLSVPAGNGSVPAGGSDVLSLDFDATGLSGGEHATNLVFNHSGEGTLIVPIVLTVITDGTAAGEVPEVLALGQNHPNPFNPKTTIRYGLPAAGAVRLTVFDIEGRALRTLVDGDQPAGSHQAIWDGRDAGGAAVASGIYFYRLETAGERIQRKMLLLK